MILDFCVKVMFVSGWVFMVSLITGLFAWMVGF